MVPTFTGPVVAFLTFTGQLWYSHLLDQLSYCLYLLANCAAQVYWISCHIAQIYWLSMVLIFSEPAVTLLTLTGQLWYSHLLNQLSHCSYLPASYDTHIYWNSCHIAHIYWPAMVITFTEPVVTLLTFICQLWCPHLLDQLSHCLYLLASCGTHIYWTSCHISHIYWLAMVFILAGPVVTLLIVSGQLCCSYLLNQLPQLIYWAQLFKAPLA